MVIIASTANTNIHQFKNFNSQNNNNNNNHFHDASFSSYLNEGTFAESSKNFNTLISSNRKDLMHHGINKEEDGEIGVFAAEKYFNGGGREEVILSPNVSEMDSKYQNHHIYQKEEESTVLETGRYKGNNKYETPSVRSESSWNSQSALLQNSMMMRESSRNKNKSQRKTFLAGLGCKCYCSDKNSVDVSNHAGEVSYNCKKTSSYGLDHGKTAPKKHINADICSNYSDKTTKQHHAQLKDVVYFQKPNRENGLQFSAVKMQIQELEKPKKSLEVFGSPIFESRISNNNNKSMSFDERLNNPSYWNGPPKLVDEIDKTENSGCGGGNYNDAESDASSDLFEIESLTGKSNTPFFSRPISSYDVASGCASPTNCYAPSEVSIEWSVVTASAVEYSAMSDYDDQRSVATIRSPIRPTLPSSNGKPKGNTKDITPRRRHPGMLLGCKSQKSVGVAADAFTTCERPSTNQQFRRQSDTFSQVTRFQAEAKEASFGARHGQHGYASMAAAPLQRSHSPHASRLLYI